MEESREGGPKGGSQVSVALSMRSWERIQSRPYRIISVVYASVICKTLKENNSAVYMELNQSDILVRCQPEDSNARIAGRGHCELQLPDTDIAELQTLD